MNMTNSKKKITENVAIFSCLRWEEEVLVVSRYVLDLSVCGRCQRPAGSQILKVLLYTS